MELGTEISFIKDEWVTIRSMEYMGQFNRSDDGKYIVSWRQGNGSDNKGEFIVAYNNKLVFHGRIRRPMEAFVSNTGVSIFEDCRFTTNHLKASVIIKDSYGKDLFSKELKTLLVCKVGISNSGNFAAYVTSGGPSRQANCFYFIDVCKGEVVWNCKNIFWPDYIIIDDYSGIISVINLP